MAAETDRYIEIGMTALRDPATGAFEEPVPLFIRASGKADTEEQKMIDGIGNVLADMMKRYVSGCRKAGVAV